MNINKIVLRNVQRRKLSSTLTALSVALGVALYIAIGTLREASEKGFQRTAAICDTIVGAKGDGLQLSLNTLYHMGLSAGNISLASFQEINNLDGVAWSIPVALGDSYRGHRIVGVSSEFFERVMVGENQNLDFAQGEAFKHTTPEFVDAHHELFSGGDHSHDHHQLHNNVFKAVLGADVARSLNLSVGDVIVPSHGVESATEQHGDAKSEVVGVLLATGTPIDRAIYIPILAYYLMEGHGVEDGPEFVGARDARGLSAIMMSTKAGFYRQQIFRTVNNRLDAMAIFPSVEMRKLFDIIGSGDLILRTISLMVVVVALIGILVSIYNTMGSRRKEFAVLRAMGASRKAVLRIVSLESAAIAGGGAVLGLVFAALTIGVLSSQIHAFSGVSLNISAGVPELFIFIGVTVAGAIAGLVPALEAYRTDAATQLSSNA
jgi:putative ABC transport system permease protein